jgi:hypothetical protein
MLKIMKKHNQIEQKEKSVQEAELEPSIQKDIEQERKAKREREIDWILDGGKYPE